MRLLTAIITFFLLLPAAMVIQYYEYSREIKSVGPYPLLPSGKEGGHSITFSTPTQSLAEIECTGGSGSLEIVDIFSGEIVFSALIHGQISEELVIPHEGSYYVAYFGNGSLSCVIRFKENYPTESVQNAIYTTGTVSALVLAILLWRRWRR
ncbi:hypothetical protein P8X24_06025 [Pyrococcus kukulkanii]|uniref:hypothetical protein n=1 Tax=Pyrococcus kukulkanii TaxID=1609559 RepID=UPI003565AF44